MRDRQDGYRCKESFADLHHESHLFYSELYLYVRFFLTVSFTQVSRKFFPELSVGFDDPRVQLHVGDGMYMHQ